MSMIFAATDIFVMPSVAESFGMVAIESMASGVPIIAFKGTALEEIVVDGMTGRLVEQGDVEALRSAIEELAYASSLRKHMSENSRRIARERYDIERYVQQTVELYRHVLESS